MSSSFNTLSRFDEDGIPSEQEYVNYDGDLMERVMKVLPEKKNQLEHLDSLGAGVSKNLVISTGDRDFSGANLWVTFLNENADYFNTLFYFVFPIVEGLNDRTFQPVIFDKERGEYRLVTREEILQDEARDTPQNILDRTIVFPNVKKRSSAEGGRMKPGYKVQLKYNFGDNDTETFPNQVCVAFGIVPDGWNPNSKALKEQSSRREMLFTDDELNPLGLQQAIMLNASSSSAVLSFEDVVTTEGDRDFSDVIFLIEWSPPGCVNMDHLPSLSGSTLNQIAVAGVVANNLGTSFKLTAAQVASIKSSSDDSVFLIHCIRSHTAEANEDLFKVFSRMHWAFPTTVDKKDVHGNDDNRTTRLTMTVPKDKVLQLIIQYKASENQSAVYWDDSAIKNIVKLQTKYLYGEETDGNSIVETLAWRDTQGVQLLKDETRAEKEYMSSTTGQGDPHITTIRGVNYLLPHIESILAMYDNDELLINTEMKRFAAYAEDPNPVLQKSTFMNRTAFILHRKTAMLEYVVIDNHSLEVLEQSSPSLVNIRVGGLTSTTADGFPTQKRLVQVKSTKLGTTKITFLSMPTNRDKLNEMTITEAYAWQWSPAIGAMLTEGNFVWKQNILGL